MRSGRQGDDSYLSAWEEFTSMHGVRDARSFVQVAYIHNGGYIGGLVGLIAAILYLRRRRAGVP